MHYAIFKAERHDVMWSYRDNTMQVELYNKWMIEDKMNWSGRMLKCDWLHEVGEHGVQSRNVPSGECVVWEGEVNLERLRASDNFYLPNFERHFEILRVETNAEGEIVYHVNYSKPFYENGEKSRLEAIEEWIQTEFTDANTYDDLIESESFKEKWDKEYNKYQEARWAEIDEYVKSEKNKADNLDAISIQPSTYTSRDNEDANFENTCIGVSVFLVVLFGTLALLWML